MRDRVSSRVRWRALTAIAWTLLGAGTLFAMNLNLACPWSDTCSPPQSPYLAFHSPQSETCSSPPAKRSSCSARLACAQWGCAGRFTAT